MRHTFIMMGLWLIGTCGCRQPAAPVAATDPAIPTQAKEGSAMGFTVTSTAFADGQPIPAKYTGDGADVSPPLAWEGAPKSTVELALICEDPDAPDRDFVHWVAYGMAPGTASLAEGATAGLTAGRNDFGTTGYKGPAPPRGKAHHYRFRLMALDAKTGLGAGADKQALRDAVKGHVLAEADLIGTYQR